MTETSPTGTVLAAEDSVRKIGSAGKPALHTSIKIVDKNFHSRFSTKKKYYLYQILNRNTQSYIHENKVWFMPQKINIERMKNASEYFLGKNVLPFKIKSSIDIHEKTDINLTKEWLKKNRTI